MTISDKKIDLKCRGKIRDVVGEDVYVTLFLDEPRHATIKKDFFPFGELSVGRVFTYYTFKDENGMSLKIKFFRRKKI